MEESTGKVYTKKNKRIKWGRFVICAVIIAYIIMFVYTFFSQHIDSTTPITYGEIEVSEIVPGYITRNERIVTSTVSGDVYPIINEGERVSKGQTVAVVRNDNNEIIEEKIKEINNKLSNLSTPTVFNNDIVLLENEVSLTLNALMLENYNQTFSALSDAKNKIENKLGRRSEIIGQGSAKGTIENQYYEELKKYEAQLTISRAELTAPIAGTVAYKLDGYEQVFSASKIGDYDATIIEKLEVPNGELVGTVKPNSFKIVDNIEGYITVVSSSDNALKASVDKKIKLRFPEIGTTEITGKIEYITIDNGKAVITFRINRGIEELINYRKIKTELIWSSNTGFKLPSSAIKRDGEKNMIYVKNGNRLIEKKVKIVAEWNGESIIEEEDGGNQPYLYDTVVVDASKISKEKIAVYD